MLEKKRESIGKSSDRQLLTHDDRCCRLREPPVMFIYVPVDLFDESDTS